MSDTILRMLYIWVEFDGIRRPHLMSRDIDMRLVRSHYNVWSESSSMGREFRFNLTATDRVDRRRVGILVVCFALDETCETEQGGNVIDDTI